MARISGGRSPPPAVWHGVFERDIDTLRDIIQSETEHLKAAIQSERAGPSANDIVLASITLAIGSAKGAVDSIRRLIQDTASLVVADLLSPVLFSCSVVGILVSGLLFAQRPLRLRRKIVDDIIAKMTEREYEIIGRMTGHGGGAGGETDSLNSSAD